MKILLIITSLGVGGEQKAARILTNEFIKKGHKVFILSLLPKSEKTFLFNSEINISYIKHNNTRLRHFNRICGILDASNRIKPDVILAFAAIPSIYCSALRKKLGIPVVITERNDPKAYPIVFKAIRRMVFPQSDFAVFQTNEASKCYPFISNSKKAVIPNAVDTENLVQDNILCRRKVIVNISRFVNSKRQEDLIKAFASISTLLPNYTLELYGDGPTKQQIIKYAMSVNCPDKICFFDSDPNVWNKIKDASIFVLCSEHEGIPNSLIEALYFGVPSISTNCRIGGPKDLINDRENGILVPVRDVNSLAKAILEIANDQSLADKFSANSKKKMLDYTPEIIADKWLRIFQSVAQG